MKECFQCGTPITDIGYIRRSAMTSNSSTMFSRDEYDQIVSIRVLNYDLLDAKMFCSLECINYYNLRISLPGEMITDELPIKVTQFYSSEQYKQ